MKHLNQRVNRRARFISETFYFFYLGMVALTLMIIVTLAFFTTVWAFDFIHRLFAYYS